MTSSDQRILINDEESISSNPPTVILRGTHESPTLVQSIKNVFTNSWINVLLIFVPFGYIAEALNWSDTTIFVLNFLAIVPLAKLLGFATEDISLRVGQTIGGLLNATFGNAVELILSIIALKEGEIRVVQASILGSIISNLLLVLGMCFVAGGYYHKTQKFNQTAAQTTSSLMTLACISLIVPAAFISSVDNLSVNKDSFTPKSKTEHQGELLNLSHGTAIVLLIIYVLYLFFQLKTHAGLYEEQGEEGQEREGPKEEEEEPQLSLVASISLLVIVTVAVAFSAEYLVGSIEGIVETSGLSKTFVGLILLPIVGNAAEHVTAITVAMKNKMDLAIGVAAGSSMQIALFVSPFLVILGWIIGQEMTLFFQPFETVVLFISVLITNYLIQDGESNWLEGSMLLATYTIIGLAFFFYPSSDDNYNDPDLVLNIFE